MPDQTYQPIQKLIEGNAKLKAQYDTLSGMAKEAYDFGRLNFKVTSVEKYDIHLRLAAIWLELDPNHDHAQLKIACERDLQLLLEKLSGDFFKKYQDNSAYDEMTPRIAELVEGKPFLGFQQAIEAQLFQEFGEQFLAPDVEEPTVRELIRRAVDHSAIRSQQFEDVVFLDWSQEQFMEAIILKINEIYGVIRVQNFVLANAANFITAAVGYINLAKILTPQLHVYANYLFTEAYSYYFDRIVEYLNQLLVCHFAVISVHEKTQIDMQQLFGDYSQEQLAVLSSSPIQFLRSYVLTCAQTMSCSNRAMDGVIGNFIVSAEIPVQVCASGGVSFYPASYRLIGIDHVVSSACTSVQAWSEESYSNIVMREKALRYQLWQTFMLAVHRQFSESLPSWEDDQSVLMRRIEAWLEQAADIQPQLTKVVCGQEFATYVSTQALYEINVLDLFPILHKAESEAVYIFNQKSIAIGLASALFCHHLIARVGGPSAVTRRHMDELNFSVMLLDRYFSALCLQDGFDVSNCKQRFFLAIKQVALYHELNLYSAGEESAQAEVVIAQIAELKQQLVEVPACVQKKYPFGGLILTRAINGELQFICRRICGLLSSTETNEQIYFDVLDEFLNFFRITSEEMLDSKLAEIKDNLVQLQATGGSDNWIESTFSTWLESYFIYRYQALGVDDVKVCEARAANCRDFLLDSVFDMGGAKDDNGIGLPVDLACYDSYEKLNEQLQKAYTGLLYLVKVRQDMQSFTVFDIKLQAGVDLHSRQMIEEFIDFISRCLLFAGNPAGKATVELEVECPQAVMEVLHAKRGLDFDAVLLSLKQWLRQRKLSVTERGKLLSLARCWVERQSFGGGGGAAPVSTIPDSVLMAATPVIVVATPEAKLSRFWRLFRNRVIRSFNADIIQQARLSCCMRTKDCERLVLKVVEGKYYQLCIALPLSDGIKLNATCLIRKGNVGKVSGEALRAFEKKHEDLVVLRQMRSAVFELDLDNPDETVSCYDLFEAYVDNLNKIAVYIGNLQNRTRKLNKSEFELLSLRKKKIASLMEGLIANFIDSSVRDFKSDVAIDACFVEPFFAMQDSASVIKDETLKQQMCRLVLSSRLRFIRSIARFDEGEIITKSSLLAKIIRLKEVSQQPFLGGFLRSELQQKLSDLEKKFRDHFSSEIALLVELQDGLARYNCIEPLPVEDRPKDDQAACLKWIEEKRLVLSEVALTQETGIKLLKLIRKKCPRLPVAVDVRGLPDQTDYRRLLESPALAGVVPLKIGNLRFSGEGLLGVWEAFYDNLPLLEALPPAEASAASAAGISP